MNKTEKKALKKYKENQNTEGLSPSELCARAINQDKLYKYIHCRADRKIFRPPS